MQSAAAAAKSAAKAVAAATASANARSKVCQQRWKRAHRSTSNRRFDDASTWLSQRSPPTYCWPESSRGNAPQRLHDDAVGAKRRPDREPTVADPQWAPGTNARRLRNHGNDDATWTIPEVAASTEPNDDDIRHTVRAHQRSTSSDLVDVSQRTDFKLAQQTDDRAKSQVTTVDLGVDPMAPFQF
jgi:hypothetical protein